MGKKIDGFIATLLPGIAVWIYLSSKFENRIIPVAAAVLACILIGKAARKIFAALRKIPVVHKRKLRKNAGAAMLRIACLPQERAHDDIYSLIKKCYPQSEFTLEVNQQHPSLKLSEAAIFQAWKKHADKDRLVICSSCRTDPVVRAFALSLPSPKITLIDSDMLSLLFLQWVFPMLFASTPRRRQAPYG